MSDRLELEFRRAALPLLTTTDHVLAAVSGGPDSVALLHLLGGLARRRQLEITVAHLDHGLRRGSRADRRFVERLAGQLGLTCLSDRRDVPQLRRRDESPEEAARRVRRQFLLELRDQCGAQSVALGHHRDDQAETILMRLVRGAGPSALTGMRASGPGPFVRPLLGLGRGALREWLDTQGLNYRIDPSNRDLRFDRNRVRRQVLPLLTETLNPQAGRHLVQAAQRLRDDAEFLDQLAQRQYDECVSRKHQGDIGVPRSTLADSPAPLALRVARLALLDSGIDARRMASRHLEALIALSQGPGGKRIELPGGIVARTSRDEVQLQRG